MRRATVRPIAPHEAAKLRAVRLRSLADMPLAFGSTHAREAAYPPETWDDWARDAAVGARQTVLLAVDDAGEPVRLASGVIDRDDPGLAHLYAMWVAPEARGAGVGAALVEATARWAPGRGATTLRTSVTIGNDAAARLYARTGFRTPAPASRLATRTAETVVLERALPSGRGGSA